MGSFSQFNLEHWLKVKAERARLGIERHTHKGADLPDHALLGTTLVDRTTGKHYLVERVSQDWLQGGFLTALMSCEGSLRACVIDAVSCDDPTIARQAAQFVLDFTPLH